MGMLNKSLGAQVKYRGFRKDRRHLGAFQDGLEYWWRQPLGRAVFEAQEQRLEPFLAKTFGYHYLQMGISPHVSLTHLSPIKHSMLWSPKLISSPAESILVADAHALPLPDDSVDVVLVHHLLDFVDNPHQVLREAARVTQHKGHLIIIGFNPTGFWGGCRFIPWKKSVPWGGRFIGLKRLNDWLTLLDYRIEDIETVFLRPAINNSRWLQRTQWLESVGFLGHFGASYIVWAKKQAGCATPIRRKWQEQFISGVVPSASTKGASKGISRTLSTVQPPDSDLELRHFTSSHNTRKKAKVSV
ncbi:Methyltransferase domain-containing protein [Oceanospirillum multiglobuliferum]|uniref:Methyltransferase type 11 domain-containing protein n=2 Tax=Oceanospirillum multiglobuliferum TaxID=64969 RepID=A0A1T4SCI5_9GAMM|nr:hypothetical protein BTE48_11235 [Oceanospirillum multiglobuliferum]SKA25836.1 Methyltransferase domain-containing protein [Oceanospirillum multiglobuliferum]